MRLHDLVQVSSSVAATSGRLEKISKLASLLSRLLPDEVPIAVGFLIGWPRQGKLGVGWAAVSAARETTTAASPSLELRDVDAVFDQLPTVKGKNSGAARAKLLGELFSRATIDEQNFLGNLLVGEVRQGALEGVLLEAIAKAAEVPAARVRRAAMMAGDLGVVARAALGEDRENALAEYQLKPFRPVQPMLADSAPSVAEALSAGVPAAVERKLD
jgi:DNA ligase-1